MQDIKLGGEGEQALNVLQNTPLSPMDEALFKAWALANQIKKPDDPTDGTDYRGIYKASGGIILPNGELHRIAKKTDSAEKLKTILQQRMVEHADKLTQQYRKKLDAATPRESTTKQTGS